MTSDAELLRHYAIDRSQEAFAELVRRNVDLVYCAALRQMAGDHHRAQEVTQMVFTDLSRKAASLARHPALVAWLHRSTYLAAASIRRRERRRQRHELAAAAEMPDVAEDTSVPSWESLRPVLDDALNKLSERDREAVLLRYFANRPFAEVGRHLDVTENAARMRVERALDRLRGLLAGRGITSSSAALAMAFGAQESAAAPAGVAQAATAAAIAGGLHAAGASLGIVTMSKAPLALTCAALILGSAIVATQRRAIAVASLELAELVRENQAIPALQEQNRALTASVQQADNLRAANAALLDLRRQVSEAEAAAGAGRAGAGPRLALAADAPVPVYDPKSLDHMPVLVQQARPQYPKALRDIGTGGQALVDFVVGSDGRVYNASAVSSTDPQFADAAVFAVSQWTFKPGQMNGQNVSTHMQVPIVFTVSPAKGPTAATWF